ncbi:MAG: CpsD/CapB family tyrosine-protein kinase [bacterium]
MKWQFLREENLANGSASSSIAPDQMMRWGSRPQPSMNGKPMNGMSTNGKAMNGKATNGKPLNGAPLNGGPVNVASTAGNYFQLENETGPALTPEQFKLRNMLLLARERKEIRSVLVTGTEKGVGVTSVAADLALGLSWDHRQEVLLIEANLHRPRLRELFRLTSESCGWILEDGAEYLDVVVTGMPNLVVIPAGGACAATTFDAGRLAETMPALREMYDFIIIDAPPVKMNPEFLALSAHFDGVILVAEAERTRLPALEEAAAALDRAEANVLGVVLNREKARLPAAIENWL